MIMHILKSNAMERCLPAILSGMLPIPSRTLPLPDGIDVSAGIHGVRPDWREFDSDRGCIIVGGIPQGGYP